MTQIETRVRSTRFPPALQAAHAAVAVPEVQDMIRRLADYGLGICLPHSHDAATGSFAELLVGVVQVEKEMRVSFQSAAEIEGHDNYVNVGWRWVGDTVTGSAVCHQKCIQRPGDSQHYSEHESGT